MHQKSIAYYEKWCNLYLLTFTFILIICWNYYTLDACVRALSFQSCPTLCDPMDCSPSGSSVHRILQARILSGLPLPPPGDLSDPGMHPLLPVSLVLQADSLSTGPPGKLGLIKEVIKITLPYFYLLVMWQGETSNSTHGVALHFYTECCLEF